MTRETTVGQAPLSVLVVDDSPANLQLLTGMLTQRGYRVRPVDSGELALQAAQDDPPDLLLPLICRNEEKQRALLETTSNSFAERDTEFADPG
jgi:CheY-like chemotaxis protein